VCELFFLFCTGLRGATADVVILEEAAFMDKAVFQAVCVPLLGVKDTALLAISTPDDEFNFYSELFEMKRPDGETLFLLIPIGLACQDCMEEGLQCQHKLDKLPHCKLLSVFFFECVFVELVLLLSAVCLQSTSTTPKSNTILPLMRFQDWNRG
jgi:hypothetical protein